MYVVAKIWCSMLCRLCKVNQQLVFFRHENARGTTPKDLSNYIALVDSNSFDIKSAMSLVATECYECTRGRCEMPCSS